MAPAGCGGAVRIYEKPDVVVSFELSRYGIPKTLGELIRKCRLNKDLYAKTLAMMLGVDKMTITSWEKRKSTPSRKYLLLLKETLDIPPSEFAKYLGVVSPRLKSILDYIIDRGEATRATIQEGVGIKKPQVANTDLPYDAQVHARSWLHRPQTHLPHCRPFRVGKLVLDIESRSLTRI